MVNLKRALIPAVAGVTIGGLLAGALWTGSNNQPNALAAPNPVAPQATSSRSTSFQIVNMGSAAAPVTVRFYNSADGSQLGYQPSQTLQPGGSMLLDQRFDNNLPTGFTGSGVGESSQRLAAIVNEVTADGGVDGFNALTSETVRNSAICHFVTRNTLGQGGRIYNTIVHVQNAGSANATVNGSIYNLGGANVKPIATLTIAPGASQAIVLENDPALGNNFFGSVALTSDQPIAVAAEQYTSNQIVDYACPGSGTRSVSAPAIYRIDGLFGTSAIVANFGDTPTNVTLEFVDLGRPDRNVSFNDTIPAKSMKFYDQRFENGGHPVANGFFGKLRVTADQDIAVLVQQLGAPADFQAAAYLGVPTAELSTTLNLPLIYSQVVDPTTGINWNTGFIVDNPNGTPTNLTMEFTSQGGAKTTANWTIPPNSSQNFEQRPDLGPNSIFAQAGNFGAVKITSNVPIAAIVNQVTSKAQEAQTQYNDAFIGYNAIPQ